MTESYSFFSGATYSETEFAEHLAKIVNDGYLYGVGSELAVIQSTPAAKSIVVGTGAAMIQGYYYKNDAAKTISVPDAGSTERIDRIVLRIDFVNDTITAERSAGTPGAGAPALIQNTTYWEISLAQVVCPVGSTSRVTADITDERLTSYCGVAGARVGKQHANTDGTFDFGVMKGVNLVDPTAAQDAATKAYCDSICVKSGMIMMWNSSIATIPSGYLLCDGAGGSTPNLTGKFVICADTEFGSPGPYPVFATGGAASVTLTTTELPAHTHGVPVGNTSGSGQITVGQGGSATVTSDSTGSGAAFSILPPYYALCYIMKV